MQVADIQLRKLPDGQELSARIDDQKIWFRFPEGCEVSTRGDAFLAAALLPAMIRGGTLEIDPRASVSPALLRQVNELQAIFHCWNPALQRIRIEAAPKQAQAKGTGAMAFFTEGANSIYTFLQHKDEISHLVFIRSSESSLDQAACDDARTDRAQKFAVAFGKTLLTVDANVGLLRPPESLLPLGTYCGAILAAAGLSLSFPATYLAAGVPYSVLLPNEARALTDPLWSNEATCFRHDGAEIRRSEKLRIIAADPAAKDVVRVCRSIASNGPSEGSNCGACDRCMRTRITLRLLGIGLPTLQRLESLRQARRLRIEDDVDLADFEDNLELAQKAGDREAWKILRSCILKYQTRKLLAQADRLLLHGRTISKQVVNK